MYKKLLLGLFFALAVAQLGTPVSMILRQEKILKSGAEFKFRTQPVDPFDAFRGRYVALQLEEDHGVNLAGSNFKSGEKVFAQIVAGDDGFAKLGVVARSAPKDTAFIKARVSYVSGDKVHLNLPVDRYYMEESKAPKAEELYRKHSSGRVSDAYVVVKIIDGEPVVKALYVAGKPVEELLK